MTTTFTIICEVPATCADAFAAWSTDRLPGWWWPQHPDTDYRFDPARERHWEISSASRPATVAGSFTGVEPGRRLGFTWTWSDEVSHGEESTVEVTFAPSEAGSRVTLAHTCAADDVAAFRREWEEILDRLVGLMAASRVE